MRVSHDVEATHPLFGNLATLVVDDRRRLSRISARTCFPRQQGGRASSLVCAHLREDADVTGRLELPWISPGAQPASSSALPSS